jgi:hypothetical protein
MAILRIERDRATRIVARLLRDDARMQSAQANELADRIVSNLSAAMREETKPLLARSKLIPEHPPAQAVQAIMGIISAMRQAREEYADPVLGSHRLEHAVNEIWRVVHKHGIEPPEDIVRTDT